MSIQFLFLEAGISDANQIFQETIIPEFFLIIWLISQKGSLRLGHFWVPAEPLLVQADQYSKWYTNYMDKIGQTKALEKKQSVIMLIKSCKDFIAWLLNMLMENNFYNYIFTSEQLYLMPGNYIS